MKGLETATTSRRRRSPPLIWEMRRESMIKRQTTPRKTLVKIMTAALLWLFRTKGSEDCDAMQPPVMPRMRPMSDIKLMKRNICVGRLWVVKSLL